ncbi:MAG TPA: GAF domain-containing sensor histidine kinase [Spirochaetota bacterium]|nr:GAF domain-containing sensor histidine kinase [Spirochaetota bacterium]
MKKDNNTNLRYIDATASGSETQASGIYSPSEKEIAAIDRVNRKIAGLRNVRDTLEFLFAETQDLFPCDRIGLAFFEEGGKRLALRHVIANYSPQFIGEGYTSDVSGSSLEKIFSDGTPRIINDLEAYAAANPGSASTALLLREGVMSSMTCPLLVDGRPVALLFRSARRKNAYNEREISLHLLIAERLSQAVEKTYLIDELSRAMNSYMEMLGFVTHELKSPLDSIIMMGKTMSSGYLGELSPKHKDYIDRMIRKAEYLSSIAGDYLNLSRFESGRVTFNPRNAGFIREIAEESLEIIMPQAREKNIAIEKRYSEPEISVECDQALMKIVMVNLLGNAVKYGDADGIVRLTVSAGNGTLSVAVWNSGPGFAPEEKHRLFKKFSRLGSPELAARKGSGIGLYTTWKIIQVHGGKIWADSEKGEWAEFSFTLPLAPSSR